MTSTTEGRRAQLLIDGQWIDGVDSFSVLDKFTGKSMGICQRASKEQVDKAVAAAKRSFEQVKLEPSARYKVLMKARRADRSAQGAARVDDRRRSRLSLYRRGERGRARGADLHRLRRGRQAPRRRRRADRRGGRTCASHGVHDPRAARRRLRDHLVQLAVEHGGAQGGAGAGLRQHVVVKPPEATPFSAALLAQILLDAGLPPGHLNLVQGPGRDVGGWLVANPDIAFYSFTGSTPVGKSIRSSVGPAPGRAGARQHRRDDRLRRRRPGPCGDPMRAVGVSPRRAGVHVDAAAVRPALGAGAVSRRAC